MSYERVVCNYDNFVATKIYWPFKNIVLCLSQSQNCSHKKWAHPLPVVLILSISLFLSVCMSLYHMHAVPMDPLELSYSWFLTAMWVLEFIPGSWEKAASSLNCWTISPLPCILVLFCLDALLLEIRICGTNFQCGTICVHEDMHGDLHIHIGVCMAHVCPKNVETRGQYQISSLVTVHLIFWDRVSFEPEAWRLSYLGWPESPKSPPASLGLGLRCYIWLFTGS